MKKVILISVLVCFSFISNGQKVYYNKTDYTSALKEYNDKMDSYLNYNKKLNYLKNFSHFPDVKDYPKTQNEWTNFLVPYFEKEQIRFDNPKNRFRPNVTPDGTIFINFYHYPNTNNIVVSTSKNRISNDPNCLYSADYYVFFKPEKTPIYKDTAYNVGKKDTLNSIKYPTYVEVKTIKKHELYVPPVKLDIYLMPDGRKYNYKELIQRYPSMANKIVFDSNFNKNLSYVQ